MKNEVKKLGRPVNENSVRQLRLKELELKRNNGEEPSMKASIHSRQATKIQV